MIRLNVIVSICVEIASDKVSRSVTMEKRPVVKTVEYKPATYAKSSRTKPQLALKHHKLKLLVVETV